jgi:hypothetical protein
MSSTLRVVAATVAAALSFGLSDCGAVGPPTDNPLAAYYSGDEGYPAWTDRIRWSNVLDMSAYKRGKTEFERFENARDELAAKGGGVLYYPAGTYDFSAGPFDGPNGRGLMLRPGVVIRGEAPAGKPKATDGKLDLKTRFVFGMTKRTNAIETGDRASVWLDGAAITDDREPRPVRLQLAMSAKDGKIQGSGAAGYVSLFKKDEHPVQVKVVEQGDTIRLDVTLDVKANVSAKKGKETVTTEIAKKGTYSVTLKREGDKLGGTFSGKYDDKDVKGTACGALFSVKPETPRDWNLIGLAVPKGKRLKDVDDVGIAWVHLVGAVIYFGPDNEWGKTWRTAGGWKSDFVQDAWANRVPDGTHPWDPLVGGGKVHVGAGSGRLVFGCVLQDSCGVNNSITMGRPDTPSGFGPDGYYMAKFTPRIAVYGPRVLVANNLLPMSTGRNFKYLQKTRYSYPAGKGNSMAFGEESVRPVLFDYNKVEGIDVNKTMVSQSGQQTPEQNPGTGAFNEGVVVRDNWVFNNGHKGLNISGTWVTIRDNRNERAFLREAADPYFIGGWELTLDGYVQTSAGGNGAISDNLSRGYDLAGANLWVDRNWLNNTGSSPGNDGEGILCQLHGGTHLFSWAMTRNTHEKGEGHRGYIGGWNVRTHGAMIAWNKTAGWAGCTMFPEPPTDMTVIANQADEGAKGHADALTADPGGPLKPPTNVKAEIYQGDAVKITWQDASDNEIGFRVERRIGGGAWTAIAYRPAHIQGSKYNLQEWVDFVAPPGKKLAYRVVAINSKDDDSGASAPTTIELNTKS